MFAGLEVGTDEVPYCGINPAVQGYDLKQLHLFFLTMVLFDKIISILTIPLGHNPLHGCPLFADHGGEFPVDIPVPPVYESLFIRRSACSLLACPGRP